MNAGTVELGFSIHDRALLGKHMTPWGSRNQCDWLMKAQKRLNPNLPSL